MPDRRTSELDLVSALGEDDLFAVVQPVPGGVLETRRATMQQLRALFGVADLEARIAALEAGGGSSPAQITFGDGSTMTFADGSPITFAA